jgi:hypothetical protein
MRGIRFARGGVESRLSLDGLKALSSTGGGSEKRHAMLPLCFPDSGELLFRLMVFCAMSSSTNLELSSANLWRCARSWVIRTGALGLVTEPCLTSGELGSGVTKTERSVDPRLLPVGELGDWLVFGDKFWTSPVERRGGLRDCFDGRVLARETTDAQLSSLLRTSTQCAGFLEGEGGFLKVFDE